MPSNVETGTVGLERCVSCDAPLSGPYCSRCGERTLEPEALTLRYFLAHTVLHELVHVESSLWRTLRLLFVRPAALSLANYGYVLEVGKIVLENTGEALLVDENVRKAYLGDVV